MLEGAAGAAKAGSEGEIAVGGARFGDVECGADEDVKYGESCVVDAVKFGEVELVATVGGKFGDTEVLDLVGWKLGDVANGSERFEGAVANRVLKSGEVEPVIAAVTSCTRAFGHTVSAPSSTWS